MPPEGPSVTTPAPRSKHLLTYAAAVVGILTLGLLFAQYWHSRSISGSCSSEAVEPILNAAGSTTPFSKAGKSICYGGKILRDFDLHDADVKTFVIVNDYYAKDSKNVYFYEFTNYPFEASLTYVDPDTFTPYSAEFPYMGRDAQHVYSEDSLVPGADVATFQIYNSDFAKDKNAVYSICRGEECDFGPLPTIDAASFAMFSTDGYGYAKDKNRYYFAGHHGLSPVPTTSTSTFVIIDNCFAKDAAGVYSGITRMEEADLETFAPFKGYDCLYAKDARHVFINGSVVPELDPKTFMPIDTLYAKDSKKVYMNQKQIISDSEDNFVTGADPATFIVLQEPSASGGTYLGTESLYAKDARHVYFGGDVITGADPKTFQVVTARFGKDAQHVYLMTEVVPEADATTFVADPSGSAWMGMDKNGTWNNAEFTKKQ